VIIGGRALLMLIAARFSGPGSGKDLLSRAISLIASGLLPFSSFPIPVAPDSYRGCANSSGWFSIISGNLEMDSNPRSPVDPMFDSAGVPCPDKFVGLTRDRPPFRPCPPATAFDFPSRLGRGRARAPTEGKCWRSYPAPGRAPPRAIDCICSPICIKARRGHSPICELDALRKRHLTVA
jgi:hypothetical protein